MKPIGAEGPTPAAHPKTAGAKARQTAQSPANTAPTPSLAPQEALEVKTPAGKSKAPVLSLVDEPPAQAVSKAGSKGPAKAGATAKAQASKSGRQVKVSAYGPGLYGNKTADGRVLRRDTVGVAHKSLPLGSKVDISINGKTITAEVIDRGPYVGNRQYDLTEALIKQFGFKSCAEFGIRTVTARPH